MRDAWQALRTRLLEAKRASQEPKRASGSERTASQALRGDVGL